MNPETTILSTWKKFPDFIPDGDTRKVLIAFSYESRVGNEVKFDIAWWYSPTKCFKYLLIEDANHLVLYWMELPDIII